MATDSANTNEAGGNGNSGSGTSYVDQGKDLLGDAQSKIGEAVEATLKAVKENPMAAAAITTAAAAAVAGAVFGAGKLLGTGEEQGSSGSSGSTKKK